MNDLCYLDVLVNGKTEQRKIIGYQKIVDLFGDVESDEYEPIIQLKKGETSFKDINGKTHIRKGKNV